MTKIVESIFGVKCKGCNKRKHRSHFVGCVKCGEPYCIVCTAGRPDSRICTSCENEMKEPFPYAEPERTG